jgi:hypothetical protein
LWPRRARREPVRALAAASLFAADDLALAAALAGWNHGDCPACGLWPVLAEVAPS